LQYPHQLPNPADPPGYHFSAIFVTTMAKTATEKKLKFTKEQYLNWYESMLLMRRFEEKTGQVYVQQKIKGFCHLFIGQEAIVAGTVSATRKGDKHITAYRDHAHPIGLGLHPKFVMAEMYAKSTGCSKGKGGSMHIFTKEFNFLGGHGIVGGQIPLGAGIAFAEKYLETGNICVCSMGDGAVRQGALHEAFNMAMTWKLPVVFIVENNMYAMGTSVERTSNVHDLWKLGLAYDMPSKPVDGLTVEAVHEAMEEAAARARRGDGPTFLELKTYRYKGHSMSDAQTYRTKDEVKQYQSQDPIEKVLIIMRENGWINEEGIEKMEERIKALVDESVKFAEESPYPEPSALFDDVYSESGYPFIKD
jgi:pyruvate dehydrogenase E1 component alpha subunit